VDTFLSLLCLRGTRNVSTEGKRDARLTLARPARRFRCWADAVPPSPTAASPRARRPRLRDRAAGARAAAAHATDDRRETNRYRTNLFSRFRTADNRALHRVRTSFGAAASSACHFLAPFTSGLADHPMSRRPCGPPSRALHRAAFPHSASRAPLRPAAAALAGDRQTHVLAFSGARSTPACWR
jgi:hypothetical protein